METYTRKSLPNGTHGKWKTTNTFPLFGIKQKIMKNGNHEHPHRLEIQNATKFTKVHHEGWKLLNLQVDWIMKRLQNMKSFFTTKAKNAPTSMEPQSSPRRMENITHPRHWMVKILHINGAPKIATKNGKREATYQSTG